MATARAIRKHGPADERSEVGAARAKRGPADERSEVSAALRQHVHKIIARGARQKNVESLLLLAGWPQDVVREYVGEAMETAAPGPALIRLKGVTKRFGGNTVLSHVDLEIAPGELFGIIGLSGAGKTTLLNILVGFLEPDAGDVLLQLHDKTEVSVFKQHELVKTMMGFAAQIPSFYGKLTVRENIEHFGALYNLSPTERITRCDRLLKLVELEGAQHTLAQNLSGGMQKRLDIACAIVHNPPMLILDEPTADLDSIIRKQLWELIQQINRQGTTVIVASHVVSELERHCSKIAILRNQRIAEIGTAAQLRDIYSRQYEVFLSTARKDYAALKVFCSRQKTLFSKMSEKEGKFVVQTPAPQEALGHLLRFLTQHRETLVHVHVDRPSIAEVFESLIRNENHPLH